MKHLLPIANKFLTWWIT